MLVLYCKSVALCKLAQSACMKLTFPKGKFVEAGMYYIFISSIIYPLPSLPQDQTRACGRSLIQKSVGTTQAARPVAIAVSTAAGWVRLPLKIRVGSARSNFLVWTEVNHWVISPPQYLHTGDIRTSDYIKKEAKKITRKESAVCLQRHGSACFILLLWQTVGDLVICGVFE